jgi:hypothetical protein
MLCCRIAAGGFALLAVSIVNASAQSCLLPWACQESRSSVGRAESKATEANSAQNMKNNLPSQKGSLRIPRPDPRRLSAADPHQQLALRRPSQRGKMLDTEKEEPLPRELRQEQRQEDQSSAPTDQAARDNLFDEFVRWQVHQVLVE